VRIIKHRQLISTTYIRLEQWCGS